MSGYWMKKYLHSTKKDNNFLMRAPFLHSSYILIQVTYTVNIKRKSVLFISYNLWKHSITYNDNQYIYFVINCTTFINIGKH